MTGKKRIVWIDIAKALGIIAVVIGHAYPQHDTFYKFLYWWHMPLFFMIGGFFLKPVKFNQFKVFAHKRLLPLLRDYFAFGLLLTILAAWRAPDRWQALLTGLGQLVYGGVQLNGTLSAFWFMTVYLLTVTLLALLIAYVPQSGVRWAIVSGAFILGTSYSNAQTVLGFVLPGDADLVLCALFYMYAGREWFRWQRQQPPATKWLGVLLTLSSLLLIAQQADVIDFKLYLKSHEISSTVLAFVVPLMICGLIFIAAYWLQYTAFSASLVFIGKHTLPIMYLHKLVFAVIKQLSGTYWPLLAVAGVVLPLMAMVLSERLKLKRRQLLHQLYNCH